MEYDFNDFWKKSIAAARKVAVDHEVDRNWKKSSLKFSAKTIQFRGHRKTPLTGELIIPSRKKKPGVIIHLHDYNAPLAYSADILPSSCAHFFLWLRGHDTINFKLPDRPSPGFLAENLLDKEALYARDVYLDVIRAVDMLRLVNEVDCKNIGLYGKNFGAAPALVAGAFSDRVAGLILDTPALCHIPEYLNLSTSPAAREIREAVAAEQKKKKLVRTNLSYLDPINFTPRVDFPVYATVGFRDTDSPPPCVFALFNHLRCEKQMHAFPDDGNGAGGKEQLKKSLDWLAEKVSAE